MPSSKQEELIDYTTAPNNDAGQKPEWDMCGKLCNLEESSVQVHFSDEARQGQPRVFKDTLQTKIGRDREVLLWNGVPHFVPSSESHLDMGDCFLNSKDPQQGMVADL